MFTLNIEMFETEYGNLVATSEPVRSESLMDILNVSGFATVEMLETFLGTSVQQQSARSQNVRAEREPREINDVNHFFALKWYPTERILDFIGSFGWTGFNVEYGQIRGNRWWWSIDGGFSYSYDEYAGFDGYYEGDVRDIRTGGTFNIGAIRELSNDVYIAYGGSVGLWFWASDVFLENSEYENTGIAGPIVRLRWRFIEVTYRGLLGTRCEGVNCNLGIGYLNQAMIGLHFSPNRRNR